MILRYVRYPALSKLLICEANTKHVKQIEKYSDISDTKLSAN